MNKKGVPSLAEQRYELIQAHIIDPENSPLPDELREQFNRVLQVARLLDDYPNDSHIINIMLAKYRISTTQVRKDLRLARELFKTNHTFDWDFWHAWQIKDQLELIRECKIKGDLKNWNNAKKTLAVLIGEKPAALDDPKRMEKNVFYIQVNNGTGEKMNISLDSLRGLSQQDRQAVIDTFYQPVDDTQVEEIMNS
ncbi:hypothetical protein [Bacteroides salyersiae]|jgi:hypothetical protein|uniref:hypothetical protein n=1 Tax=Bacteroides salyersiae TaxID=291644 RepID=UPI00189852E8|nr:hypothetical protein [Bacteroides salyersiae]